MGHWVTGHMGHHNVTHDQFILQYCWQAREVLFVTAQCKKGFEQSYLNSTY